MPKIFIALLFLVLPAISSAAPSSKLIKFWDASLESNSYQVDHSAWQQFLDDYLIGDDPYDISLFDYEAVSIEDRIALKIYIDGLAEQDPRGYARIEQKAYWINMYNALTVDLILDNYPIASITELGNKFFSFGPWNDNVISVAGKKLSLNDIEHGILRPLFKDERIHYAANCASIGCPNLASQAFTSDNIEELLELGARGYINHIRGLEIQGDTLILSSIYKWYQVDFGSLVDLRKHFIKYADPALAEQLKAGGIKNIQYQYNWELNSL